MSALSKYSTEELRAELDRRTRTAKNEEGYVRCKDCAKPEVCKFVGRLHEGVYRHCENYIKKD